MPEIIFPYSNIELTTEVNRIPNTFGLLNALDLAPSEPKRSRVVRIDFRDGQIHVLSHQEPGAPGELSPSEDPQTGVLLTIPHFVHLENILVGDIDGLLEVVNGQITEKSLDAELARKLEIIRKNHAITREFLRLGMLRGEIKDGRLRTLYNLYDVFGITKKVVDFTLGSDINVLDKCEEVADHIIGNVKGETVGSIEAIVDSKFFSKLVAHENVEKFWLQAQNAAVHTTIERQRLGGNWGRVFEFGNILFREYKGSIPVKSNDGTITSQKNVADNTGHAYPAGTQSMFRTFDAPAYHIEQVNRAPTIEGEEGAIFISAETLKHGQGFEMKSQTNALAVCKQPDCIVELTTSN